MTSRTKWTCMQVCALLLIPKDLLFVCLFIIAWAIFQLSGGCHHYRWQGCKFRHMLGAQGLWAGRDLYRATPTATRDLGFYGLIRKTGTHVPQWDSNPRLKDHQIFEPDALTTAPRGRLQKDLRVFSYASLHLTTYSMFCFVLFFFFKFCFPEISSTTRVLIG
jgi:hypothetical protein